MTRARGLILLALAAATGCGGDDDGGSGAIAFIEIRPGGLLLTPDRQSAVLEAVALDAAGTQVEASFTWSSSTPDQITVAGDGTVSAVSELGSATIRAESGEVRSDPVVVATVALHPGTVVVTDDQVVDIGEPFTPDGAADGWSAQMDVRLRGIDPPAPGTIVVSAESSPLGGSVVSAEEDGGEVAVRLELVSLPELFARYDIDWQIGLGGHTVEVEEDEAASARLLPAVHPETKKLAEGKWPKAGPFQCSGSVAAFLEKNTVDLKLAGDGQFVFKSSRLDESQAPGYLKVAIEGPVTLKGSLALRAKAGLKAKGKCELKGRIPIALGPFAIVVSPAIPLGVGVSLDAKLTAASMEIGFEGENGFDLGVGFECGPGTAPCRSLDKMDPINKWKPLLEVPGGMKDMKVEMSAQAYFVTGFDLLFLAGKYTFEAVEVTVGPVQSADLGFVDKQADDKGYASRYELKLQGKAGAGEGVENAIKKLLGKDEEAGSLGFEFSVSKPLSKSPIGALTVDKTQTSPHKKVTLTTQLDSDSVVYYLLGYNVTSIEIYRKKLDTPIYEHVKSIEVNASNQTKFTWDWTPSNDEIGKFEFYAFVKTSLPVIELEVAPDSHKEVEVVAICSASAIAGALPGGGSDCELTGTMTHTMTQTTPGQTVTETGNATVTLQQDPDEGIPDVQLAFRPYGTWSAEYRIEQANGCVYETMPAAVTGSLAGEDAEGIFYLYTGAFGQLENSYDGNIQTSTTTATAVLSCPDQEPQVSEQMFAFALFAVDFDQMLVIDPETMTATGSYTETIDGDPGTTTTNTWTWNLTLQGAEPPPPAQ